MQSLQILSAPLADAIGWALLHLVWQGFLVAGLLAAALALLSKSSANARYVAACSALALVFTLFVATAVRSWDPPVATASATPHASQPVTISLSQLPVIVAKSAAAGVRERALDLLHSARAAFPSVVTIWFAGVLLLSTRLLISWARARRWMLHGTVNADQRWQRLGASLSKTLQLRRAVTLLQSSAIEVPCVIGYLRPVIILPASTLTGLTPEQVEMVLAHEFAHIRRHDFAVNLLQAVVETLMFYHPAVWWMSHRVRVERENCCDDLAVSVCGNAVQYARALARLEELRDSAPSLVMAASGGRLLERIRRIAISSTEGVGATPRWAAGAALIGVLVVGLLVPSVTAATSRKPPAPPAPPAAPAAAPAPHAEVDVVAEAPEASETPVAEEAPDADGVEVIDIPAPGEPALPAFPAFHPFAAPPAGTPVAAVAPVAAAAPVAIVEPVPVIAPVAPVHPAPVVIATPRAIPVAAAAPAPPAAPRAYAFSRVRDERAERTRESKKEDKYKAKSKHKSDDEDDDADVDVDVDVDVEHEESEIDGLIAARAVGATPEFIASMREFFPRLSVGGAVQLAAVGVTADYIREMRAAGIDIDEPSQVTGLRALGVTAEYLRQMRAAGLEGDVADEITGLKAVGVTPEYLKEIRAAGIPVKTADDATTLRAVGVTAKWLRDMRTAGIALDDADDAAGLRALGVTAELVNRLRAAGYKNITIDQLEALASGGIDDRLFRDLEKYRK